MVEITCGSGKRRIRTVQSTRILKAKSPLYGEAKIDGHRQWHGVEGICDRDGAGRIDLGPPAFADQLNG